MWAVATGVGVGVAVATGVGVGGVAVATGVGVGVAVATGVGGGCGRGLLVPANGADAVFKRMRLGGRALVGLIGDFFLEHASAARAEYLRLAVRGSDMAVLIRGDVAFANDRALFGVLMRALVSGQAPLGG